MIFKKHWTDRYGLLNFSYHRQLEKAEQLALKRFKDITGYDGEIVGGPVYDNCLYETRQIRVQYTTYIDGEKKHLQHEYQIKEL